MQVNNNLLIGLDNSPYSFKNMFGRPSNDVYIMNIENGKKKKVLSDIKRTTQISSNNKHFIFIKENNLHLYDIEKKSSTNITENLDGKFIQGDSYDYPVEQKPPFDGGLSAWSKDENSFFINSEFDVWQGHITGLPTKRITKGKEIIYRHKFVNYNDQFVHRAKEQYFTMRGKKIKKNWIRQRKN